jgi:hypothetical protein
MTAERGARPVTRLFHQALTDELLASRHQLSDESALFDMLLGQVEHVGWQDRYSREHVAEHAVAGHRFDQLLEDPHYLLSVDPGRLVPHLDAARSPRRKPPPPCTGKALTTSPTRPSQYGPVS